MRKIIALCIALLIIGFGSLWWYRGALAPVDAADEATVMVTIEKGTSVAGIAELLREKDLVRSSWAFRFRAKRAGVESKLQAGRFLLSPSMSVDDIQDALQGGHQMQVVVTIPEGFTVKDIDALMARKGLTQTGAILACARTCDFGAYPFLPTGAALADRGGKVEGYLFPDTYFIDAESFDPKAFLGRLLATFQIRVYEKYGPVVTASGRNWHQMITMASLIEEETRKADEKPVVSGILWKRFEEGVGLGVDAAVRYIVDKPTAPITVADLNIDSPYNLRKYRGLPPGPIANPGLSSIEAAITPQDSPYWYYLHGNDGMIRYAETNDAHNENRRRYLR